MLSSWVSQLVDSYKFTTLKTELSSSTIVVPHLKKLHTKNSHPPKTSFYTKNQPKTGGELNLIIPIMHDTRQYKIGTSILL